MAAITFDALISGYRGGLDRSIAGLERRGVTRAEQTFLPFDLTEVDARLPGGGLAHLRSRVSATAETGAVSEVLDWRLIALFA